MTILEGKKISEDIKTGNGAQLDHCFLNDLVVGTGSAQTHVERNEGKPGDLHA